MFYVTKKEHCGSISSPVHSYCMHLSWRNVSHLLIVSLHAQEDGVCCEAGQTAFDIRLASQLLRLSVQVIKCPYGLFKLLFVNLKYMET